MKMLSEKLKKYKASCQQRNPNNKEEENRLKLVLNKEFKNTIKIDMVELKTPE